MSAPIATGTAYGANMASRNHRLKRLVSESSMSAATSATPIITGVWTSPNNSTRYTPLRNSASAQTSW